MKLKEFLDGINEKIKENPDILNYEVVASSDDEGNDFNPVCYSASVGYYDVDGDGWDKFRTDSANDSNAICIN